jgi:hypothetical protein
MNFKLDPIKRFCLFLSIFTAGAVVYNWSTDVLMHLAATLGFGLVLYTFYTWISSKHKNVWDTVISCEIIFLLLHPSNLLAALAFPVMAVFVAETLKFCVEWKNSPVVNPSAAGLLLTAGAAALMGWQLPFVSWWGASYWALPFGVSVSLILIALWVVGGFYVWKKWYLLASFLIAFVAFQALRGLPLLSLEAILLDSTVYFIAAVMLPEPKTSPFLPWKQVAYGVLAAARVLGFSYLQVPYAELFGVVGANLFNAGLSEAIS